MKKVILVLILMVMLSIVLLVFINRGDKSSETNLGGFYRLTSKDPLFYSPFFEAEAFKKSVKDLGEKETSVKKVLIDHLEQTTGFEKDHYIPILKEHDLFPYDFLEKLVLVNSGTKKFLENPSIELGENLLDLYDNAADAYLQAASSRIEVLEKVDSYKTVKAYFICIDSISSFEVLKNDFLIIEENARKLKEEIAQRRSCLLGKADCEEMLTIKDNSSFLDLVNAGEFDLKGEKIDFIKSVIPYSSFPESEIKGPYKIKSACWQNPGFEHWLYLVYIERDNKTIIAPKLTNQNYYQKIPTNATLGVSQIFLDEGVIFYGQSEATTYECLDLTFYPKLLTLDFLKEKMEMEQLNGLELEKNADYKLLIENHFGLIAPVIDTISYYIKILESYQVLNNSIISPEYLFSTRSAYSIFYFPFAKSIWRIDKELQYFVPEEKKPLTSREKFKTLDDLEEMGYTKEEIRKFHIYTGELIGIRVE